MNWPRLSVIVANYNHGKYLPACLNALLQQSVQPLEIIVIEDASTDNSLEVIEGFARAHPIIRVYRNEKNLGALGAALRGLDLAQGDYVFFAAADDQVMAGFLEQSLRLLAEHPQAGLSCTASKWHSVTSGLTWYMGTDLAERPAYLSPEDLVRVGRKGRLEICSSSAILRKTAFNDVGRFIYELRWHCDWFADYALAFRHGICYVPESLSDFYLHPTSYYNRGRKSAEHTRVLTSLLDRLSSPAFADIAPRVRDSTALSLFGWPIIRIMIRQRQYRRFFTPLLALWCCHRSLELVGQKLLPRPLARLILRLFYDPGAKFAQNKTP